MNNQTDPRDQQLERLLDSALAHYGGTEPQHGMEERVLRRLRESRAEGSSGRAWWGWAGAAAALAAIVVAAMLLTSKPEQKSAISTASVRPQQGTPARVVPQASPSQRTSATPGVSAKQAASVQPHGLQQQGPQQHRARQIPVATLAAMNLPKRAVFPTPAPPTEQERLLARYLRVTPRDEVLAQINRKPLEFHEDPLSAPVTTGTSPNKAEGTK